MKLRQVKENEFFEYDGQQWVVDFDDSSGRKIMIVNSREQRLVSAEAEVVLVDAGSNDDEYADVLDGESFSQETDLVDVDKLPTEGPIFDLIDTIESLDSTEEDTE